MLMVNLAIDLWRRRVPLQMCWLWRFMQFYVLGVGRKERTITDQWDLFGFDILTFGHLSLYIHPSTLPTFTVHPLLHARLCARNWEVFVKKQSPHGRQRKNDFQGKKLQTVPQSLPFQSLRCLLLAWSKPSFPPFLTLWPPRPLCALEVSSQMWPWATLLFIYIVLTRERGTWGFYNFFFPFSFFD